MRKNSSKVMGIAEYTRRDLILYALGIGCDDSELQYVYEQDVAFQAFPLFPLTLLFCAYERNNDQKNENEYQPRNMGDLPFFPPFLMRHLMSNPHSTSSDSIHLSQNFQWHSSNLKVLVPPSGHTCQMVLESSILEMNHHAKGLVVKHETKFWCDMKKGSPLATSQMTFLMLHNNQSSLKIPNSNMVQKVSKPNDLSIQQIAETLPPHFTQTYIIPKTQALLYRLSGDTNHIHVQHGLPSSGRLFSSDKPILHGLCTLGYSVRAVMNHFPNAGFVSVCCNFTNPVFVGDTIRVLMWVHDENVVMNRSMEKCTLIKFQVQRVDLKGDYICVIDKGIVHLQRMDISKL